MRSRSARGVIAVCLMACATAVAAADPPMAGRFSDGNLTVDWSAGGDGYAGTFTLRGQQFPASAHGGGSPVDGTFTASGHTFPFTAALADDTLTLTTAGVTYALKRVPPPNPLAAAATAAATAVAAPAAVAPPPGYAVAASNDAGQSLVAEKPGVTTVQAALEATFPDLAAYFGQRPTIGSAYQDAHDPHAGGATFTAAQAGRPVRGIVSCKLADGGGATVAVVYGRPDASKADWQALINPEPQQTSPGQPSPTPPAAPPTPPLTLTTANATEYDLPDGTGSIMLPDGWSSKAQSATGPVIADGPDEEQVIFGGQVHVLSPDGQTMQMRARTRASQAQVAAMVHRPPPPEFPLLPGTIVLPYTDPEHAVADLTAEWSKIGQAKGFPYTVVFDRILWHKDNPRAVPNGQAAALAYEVTRTYTDGHTLVIRQFAMVQMWKTPSADWVMMTNGFHGPADRWKQDMPVMAAILNSFKLNNDAYTQKMQVQNQVALDQIKTIGDAENQVLRTNHDTWQAGQDSRNRIYNEQHQAQMDSYASHNLQEADRQLQQQRSAADFIETIKGTRTVYDTATGETGTADLNYVNGVVDSLNQAALDPNRFVQIPLRDEMYPVK
jgi:hypothetical protein